jgi:hypothetical protein
MTGILNGCTLCCLADGIRRYIIKTGYIYHDVVISCISFYFILFP